MSNEKPDWYEIVQSKLDTEAPPKRKLLRALTTNFTDEHYDLLRLAAQERGLTSGAYMRRAIMAFAIYDLGLDYYQVLETEPRMLAAGGLPVRNAPHMKGRGFGPWIIEGLRGE